MQRIVAGAVIAFLGSCAAAHGDARRSAPGACDASGVWRIDLGSDEVLEVTVDPALVRVELADPGLGADEGVAVAIDVAACRLHVVRRATQHYEEGYGDTDTTLRLELTMRGRRTAVTGTRRVVTLDPVGEATYRVRGTAERRARWTPSADALSGT